MHLKVLSINFVSILRTWFSQIVVLVVTEARRSLLPQLYTEVRYDKIRYYVKMHFMLINDCILKIVIGSTQIIVD